MQKNKFIIFLPTVLFCVIADQLTKFFVEKICSLNNELNLIANILSLEKVYNDGAAFSIMKGNIPILTTISAIVSGLILIHIFHVKSNSRTLELFGFAFIFGGATGNLIDRLLYGHVIDFFRTDFINFPVFNFADIFINIGVIILIVSMFLYRKDDK